MRFKKNGNQNENLKYVFSSWQDEILLNMNPEKIEENYDVVKTVYNEKTMTTALKEKLQTNGLC